MSRNLVLVGLALIGCRDSGMVVPSDFALSSTDMASNGSTDMAGTHGACAAYTSSSVGAMRQGRPGCYKLDNVVSIGAKPESATSVKAELYIQDAAGGDFSALQIKCGTVAHPCADPSTYKLIAPGRSLTVTGTYIKSSSTKFEEFYIDHIVDNAAGTPPAAATVTLADIQRASTSAKFAFQKVTLNLGGETLGMYNWTPTEYVYSAATKCPYQFGFSMIPMSISSATPGSECASGTAQPAGVAAHPAEVLIDTRFYTGFTVTSDCRCAKKFSDVVPSASSTATGTISGILIFDVIYMTTTGYMALAPTSMADFPITNTVAGM